jgi:hypothetical protein
MLHLLRGDIAWAGAAPSIGGGDDQVAKLGDRWCHPRFQLFQMEIKTAKGARRSAGTMHAFSPLNKCAQQPNLQDSNPSKGECKQKVDDPVIFAAFAD